MKKTLFVGLLAVVLLASMVSATITTSGDANEQYNISTSVCKWVFEDGSLWSVNYTATNEKANFVSASTSSTMFSVRNSSGTSYFQYGTESTTQSNEYNNQTDYITMVYTNPTFGATVKYKIFDDYCYMLWETYSSTMNASITTFIQNATSYGGLYQTDYVYNNTNRLSATSGGNDYSNSPSSNGVALTYNRSKTNYSVIVMWNGSLTNDASGRVNYTYYGGSTASVEGVHLYNRGKLPLNWVARGIVEIARINTTQVTDFAAVVNTLNQTLSTRSLSQEFTLSDAATPSNLYVNQSHASCSDSYTRIQATNINTPWCTLTPPFTNELMLGGDTLIIASGNYNLDGKKSTAPYWEYNDKTLTANLTITSAPNNDVNITRYASYNWSNQGNGIYQANLTGYDSSSVRYAMLEDGQGCIVWNYGVGGALENLTKNFYNCSTYTNTTSMKLHVNNTAFIPNSTNVKVLQGNSLEFDNIRMTNGSFLIIKNLNFDFALQTLRLYNVTNAIIENNKFRSVYRGIYMNGRNDVLSGNITIRNNTFLGTLESNWLVYDLNTFNQNKGSGIYSEYYKGRVEVVQNNFSRWRSGVGLVGNAQTDHDNSEVWNNTFYNGLGSQMEIEEYCSNSSWHHNKGVQMYYSLVSFAPAKATVAKPCNFSYNSLSANSSYRWTATQSYGTEAIKVEGRGSSYMVSNWIIDHNTFVTTGRGIYNIYNAAEKFAGSFVNTTITNNIFIVNPISTNNNGATRVIERTGLSTNRVYYNNNIYYIGSGGAGMFYKWNSNSSASSFNSLALALGSAYWDGTWDTNSHEENTEFFDTSPLKAELSPIIGQYACNSSTTSSFIGAYPCTTITNILSITIPSGYNNTIIGYTTNNSIGYSFSDNRRATANCSFYIDGVQYDNATSLSTDTTYYFEANTELPNGEYTAWINCTNTLGLTNTSNRITVVFESPTQRVTNLQVTSVSLNSISLSWVNPEASDWSYNEVWVNDAYYATTSGTTYTITGLNSGTTYNITIRAYDGSGSYGTTTTSGTTRSFPIVQVNYSQNGLNTTSDCHINMIDGNFATDNVASFPYNCTISYTITKPTTGTALTQALNLTIKYGAGTYLNYLYKPSTTWFNLSLGITGGGNLVVGIVNSSGQTNIINSGTANFYESQINYTYTTTQELAITGLSTLNGSAITSATICNGATSNCTSGSLPLYLAMFNGTNPLTITTDGNYPYTTTYTSTTNETTTFTDIGNVYINWLRQVDNTSITSPICYYDSDKTLPINTINNYYYLATSTIYCLAYTRTEPYTITVTPGETLNTTLYFNWSGATITYKDSTTQNNVNNANLEVYYFGGDYYQNYTTTDSLMTVYYPFPGTYNLRYSSPGYNVRNYHIIVSNDTITPLTLYLLNGTGATNLTVTVIDEVTDPVVNVQVKLLKFDLTTNTFILEEVGTTNSNGITILSVLLNSPFYKFIVQRGNDVLKTTDPEVLTTNTKTISVGTSNTYGEEAYKYNDYTASLTFNEATGNFRLDYNDADGLGEGTALIVYVVDNMTYTLYNTSTSVSSSGSILIQATNVSGRTYAAFAYYVDPIKGGGYSYLAGKTYTYLAAPIFGAFGLFMQILLTVGASSLIFLNAPAAVVLTPLTIGLGNWLGWVQISWGVIIGLIATGILIAYMLMGKK